jgi:hypothetical protein
VYVGVSPSFLVFLEVTTVMVVYLLLPIFRFSRSTVTLSEHCRSLLHGFSRWIRFLFLGIRLILGRNHRFSYPPFLYFVCRIPTAACQPSLLLASPLLVHRFALFFCEFETFFVCFFLVCTYIIADIFRLSRGF